jgi:hypothetical protein
MKLVVNLGLSLLMLAICTWLVWPSPERRADIAMALNAGQLARMWPHLLGFVALLAVTHFCRAWRWIYLLRPLGVQLPAGRLLAISSVGFMAILALPARMGEFVRPALIRRKGEISASAALGTVAVERIVDGLLVSLLVFACCFALRGPDAPGWMMPTAYTALAVFAGALFFLAFALRWPEPTVRFALRLSLLPRLLPGMARSLEDKLLQMIRGFLVLKDRRNLVAFVLWSAIYWGANGLSMWILAEGFDLGLPPVGAFATMGLVAVGITLPNSPALVGQFQWFTQKGLELYLPTAIVEGRGLAYAIALHAIQVIWYLGVGGLALLSRQLSFSEVLASQRETGSGDTAEEPRLAPP